MAITSELIGKLGGGDIETVTVNRLVERGDSWQLLHTLIVNRPSLISIMATHDNTDAFGATNGKAGLVVRGTESAYYGSNYGVSAASGHPLTVTAELSAGTWDIEAVCNVGSGTVRYTVQTLTIATINL